MTDFVSDQQSITLVKVLNGWILTHKTLLDSTYTEVYLTWNDVMKRLASFKDNEVPPL